MPLIIMETIKIIVECCHKISVLSGGHRTSDGFTRRWRESDTYKILLSTSLLTSDQFSLLQEHSASCYQNESVIYDECVLWLSDSVDNSLEDISLKIELMNNLLGQPIFSAGSIEECKYNLNDIVLGRAIPRDY